MPAPTLELVIGEPREDPRYTPFSFVAYDPVTGVPGHTSVADYLDEATLKETGYPLYAVKFKRIARSPVCQDLEFEGWFLRRQGGEYFFDRRTGPPGEVRNSSQLYTELVSMAQRVVRDLESLSGTQLYCIAQERDELLLRGIFEDLGFTVRTHQANVSVPGDRADVHAPHVYGS